jgi:hypothetical protein
MRGESNINMLQETNGKPIGLNQQTLPNFPFQ